MQPSRRGEERIDMLVAEQRLNVERIVSIQHAGPQGFWYDDARAERVLLPFPRDVPCAYLV